MTLPETETAKKIVEETIDGEEGKDDDGIDKEIAEQVLTTIC